MAVTVNQNVAECLRSVSDFGSTTVMNICDGTSVVVPWGAVNWAAAVGVSAMLAALTLFFVVAVVVLVRS